jgi:Tfp pilus assembly protein FimT
VMSARAQILATLLVGAVFALGVTQYADAAPTDPQIGRLDTVAGTPTVKGYNGDNRTATSAHLDEVRDVVRGPDGSLFITDLANRRIRQVWPDGHITTIAGTGVEGYNGDNQLANQATISQSHNLTLSPGGDAIVFADSGNARVRSVNLTTGMIATLAGTGVAGYNGDNRLATSAQLNWPSGVAYLHDGSLLITEATGSRVRKVNTSGTITTIAGTGNPADPTDGQLAATAPLRGPRGTVEGPDGAIYIGEETIYDGSGEFVGGDRVLRIDPSTKKIARFAGANEPGFGGDGGPALDARLSDIRDLEVAGNYLFIADKGNGSVRRVDLATKVITTIAGSGIKGWLGDDIPATSARMEFIRGIDVADGWLYIAEGNAAVHKVGLAPIPNPPPSPTPAPNPSPSQTQTIKSLSSSVTARAVSRKRKLLADVHPTLSSNSFKVLIQRKSNGVWTTRLTRYTSGSAERVIVNVPRGRWRAVLPSQFGYESHVSSAVWIRR